MDEVVFFIAAIGAVAGAIGVASLRNPFYSVLALVSHPVALAFALALFVELCIAILGSGLRALGTNGANIPLVFGRPAQIGEQLLTKFLLPFEIASFLLLIAAVGAVVLARRRGGLHEEEQRVAAMDLLRPAGTGTMAEAVEGRTGTPQRELAPPAGASTGPTGEAGGW